MYKDCSTLPRYIRSNDISSAKWSEHPNAPHVIVTITDNPLQKVQSVIYENIDAEAIHRAAMTTEGSA